MADLPGDAVRSRPWLSVAYAWVVLHTGQKGAVELRLRAAERAADGADDDLVGTTATIRACAAASAGTVPEGIAFVRQARQGLLVQQIMVGSFALAMLGSLFRFAGEFAASARNNAQARSVGRVAGDRPTEILSGCDLAGTLILQGELRRAASAQREVLRCGEDGPASAVPNLPFSGLARTAWLRCCASGMSWAERRSTHAEVWVFLRVGARPR
jgi:ATP/maltotriose-dependent transcriptional regulator MalT